MTRLVLVLTGTDHHPFRRLVDWVDVAAARHPDVRFLVQHGATTPAPKVADGVDYLTHEELTRLLGEAVAVICHGGPGTIMDARAAGHVPLCVPRDPALGEHVDRHQLRFAAEIGRGGVVRHVTSAESFHEYLDQALVSELTVATSELLTSARDRARADIAVELDQLMTLRPPRLVRRRRSVR